MFKNKPARLPEGQVDTLIGPQVVIHGDLRFSGGLHVEGRVVGKVIADDGQPAVLTVAKQGVIEGEIHAPTVVIHGRLEGDVHAGERVELAAGAQVHGDVHYPTVEMAAGAVLIGRLVHAEASGTGESAAAAVVGRTQAEAEPDAQPVTG